MIERNNRSQMLQNAQTNIILFRGPPSTGKRSAAKAIAFEIDRPYQLLECGFCMRMVLCFPINILVLILSVLS